MTESEIQTALNTIGYGPLKVDGDLGKKSKEAIMRFQRANFLMADGIAGDKTQRKLSSLLAALTPVAIPPSDLPCSTEDDIATGEGFPMRLSDQGAAMLALSEGVRTKAYRDTKGIVTIGIGVTWGSAAFREWWAKNKPGQTFNMSSTLTKEQCYETLKILVDEEYGHAVNEALGKAIPQHQFDAAVHAIYNMGPKAVTWRWFLALKAGDIKEAAHLLRTGYNKPPELEGRRKKEGDLLEFGKYHH